MSGGRAGRGRSYPFSQGGSTFFFKNMPPPACCWSQAWFNIFLQLLACTRNNKDTRRNMCQKINVHCNTGVVTLVQQGSNWYATTSDVVSFIMMSNYSCVIPCLGTLALCLKSLIFTIKPFFLYSLLEPATPGEWVSVKVQQALLQRGSLSGHLGNVNVALCCRTCPLCVTLRKL